MLLTIVFGLFLIVHGLIHALWLVPKPADPKWPFDLSRSPMLRAASPATLRPIGTVLVYLAIVEFAFAGLGVLGVPELVGVWRIVAVVGAIDSLAAIALFWNRQFVVGALLDVAIIAAAVLGWPRP